jgi:hypothetical protein
MDGGERDVTRKSEKSMAGRRRRMSLLIFDVR